MFGTSAMFAASSVGRQHLESDEALQRLLMQRTQPHSQVERPDRVAAVAVAVGAPHGVGVDGVVGGMSVPAVPTPAGVGVDAPPATEQVGVAPPVELAVEPSMAVPPPPPPPPPQDGEPDTSAMAIV